MSKDLKQGQRIKFDVDGNLKGTGTIVGKSVNDMPIIGGTYIIEPDIDIINDVYQYSHFVLPENQFKLID